MDEYKDIFSEKELENIKNEFKRLNGECYLDHAGSGLYAESQISEIYKELSQNLYSNPHTSKYVGDCIEQIRYRILKYFSTDANNYSVVFTSGATAALKLAIECFNFGQNGNNKDNIQSTFAYLQECHTSVLGLREIAAYKNARIKCISSEEFLEHGNFYYFKSIGAVEVNNIFVYPAQCNFSGFKYPLDLNLPSNWYILLDAASLVANSHLDLTKVRPNFVAISFYKIFGYPSGLGALLIRKDSASLLNDKKYFGGGTVEIALSGCRFHKLRQDISASLEDGTISFLSILSLRHGFDVIERLVSATKTDRIMDRISEHTFGLAKYAYRKLSSLQYSNGSSVVKIYHNTNYKNSVVQGGIVNFNLLNPDGDFIGFAEVEHMAHLYNIHLRTGCFCNPGACQKYLRLTDDKLRKHHLAGHVCGDEYDLIDGVPTGSVRISFGYYSNKCDVDVLLNMIKTSFVDNIRNSELTVESECKKNVLEPNLIKSTENEVSVVILRFSKAFKALVYTINIIKQSYTRKILNKSQYKIKDQENLNFAINQDEKIFNNTLKSTRNSLSKFYTSKWDDKNKISKCLEENKQANNNFTNKTYSTHLNFYEPCIISNLVSNHPHLLYICIYPIKSCGAFKIGPGVENCWPVGPTGLLYDREWMIVTSSGAALTQKQEPSLCMIKPMLDVDNDVLVLSFPGQKDLTVPLSVSMKRNVKSMNLCNNTSGSTSRVCGDAVNASDCGDNAAQWLESVLNRQGVRLVRQCDKRLKSKDKQISLVNRAQFLLINSTSVQWLLDRSNIIEDLENYLDRFRANLIIKAIAPLEENNWCSLDIGGFKLKVDGPCTRCQIICIDQKTGQKSPEPLRVISNEFHGKRTFGVYLSAENKNTHGFIRCGEIVTRIGDVE